MIVPTTPTNESGRLEALRSYKLIDNLSQKEFNEIVKMASFICETPISLITLLDEKYQWFKAKVGLEVDHTERNISFCGHAINDPGQPFIVEDATKDKRFQDNPLVTGDPNIVFYAGIPLMTNDGHGLGTLCVIDNKPRQLTPSQLEMLGALSNQVMRLFELRKAILTLEVKEVELEQTIMDLEDYTSIVSHDLKTSFRNIEVASEVIDKTMGQSIDPATKSNLGNIKKECNESLHFINGIMNYSKSIGSYSQEVTLVDMHALFTRTVERLKVPGHFKINIPNYLPVIHSSKSALQHIFENLIQNSIKYMDKPKPEISITYEDTDTEHIFSVNDNGSGIEKDHLDRIFKLYYKVEKDSQESFGVGLAIVSKLTNLLRGELKVMSEVGRGTQIALALQKDPA